MNKQALLDLADRVETDASRHFDMARHETCLIGWADNATSYDFATSFDIPWKDAERLTLTGIVHPDRHYAATRQQAAKVLRHYVETGEVDWDLA